MTRRQMATGLAIGVILFLLARGSFMKLLAALGYVDGQPGSLLVSILFLACMLVMCLGYGVGVAAWWTKKKARKV